MQKKCLRWLSLLVLSVSLSRGADKGAFQEMKFTVDGAARDAWVYVPSTAKTQATPLIFVFHGHGGNARQAARSFHLEAEWPEAAVAYLQGLPTPGGLTDPEGKLPGWQGRAGGQGDRDLKFFDAVLARMQQDFLVDTNRIYATGHSNGGGFTYLLWLARGDVFAAVAPSAAVLPTARQLQPKPVLHLAGENDTLVKFAWQQRMMQALRRVNGCGEEGKEWDKLCTVYSSKNGPPVVTFVHPGGHEFRREAPALIVRFFKEHPGGGPGQGSAPRDKAP